MGETSHFQSPEDLFGHDVENIGMCSAEITSEADRFSALHAPALPESKLYHLFVCYATEDRDKAFAFVKHLEQRHGAKCLFADRDFQPGKEIRINIMEGINNSMKILTMMSPRFTQSRYCLHESEIAFQKTMETGLNYVIPVLLEACEVPYGLKPKTYIDATLQDLEDVAERIVSALHITECSNAPLSFEMVTSENRYRNGYSFNIEGSLQRCCLLKPQVYRFRMTNDVARFLKTSGVKASQAQLQKAVKQLNNEGVMNSHFCWRWHKPSLFTILLLPFFGLLITAMVYWAALAKGSQKEEQDDQGQVFVVFTSTAMVTLAIIEISLLLYAPWRMKKMKILAVENLWTNVTLKTYRDGVVFALIYSEKDVPIGHVVNTLKRRHGCDDEFDLDCETQATMIVEHWLKKFCSQNLADFPDAPTNRHNVVQDKMCICQLYEHYGY